MESLSPLISPQDPANLLQFSLRTLIALAFGVLCVRIAGRTTFSQLNALDIIVGVAVGSNLSRVMVAAAPLVPGLGATLVLVLLRRGLAAATVRWDWLGELTQGHAIVAVRDGVADLAVLRKHRVSNAELMEAVRLGGAADLSEVRLAVLEDGGRISIVRNSGDGKGVVR
jgi:uncharacterized membrane protein YcaP (DUF421 family)